MPESPALRVNASLIIQDSELRQMAEDIERLGGEFESITCDPIPRGDMTIRGLSWRCRSLSHANLLRGRELLRMAIASINEGHWIAALVLSRALDETLAAVVFARRKLRRAVASLDEERVEDALNRLLGGRKYSYDEKDTHPQPFNVMSMIEETEKYLNEMLPAGRPKGSEYRDHYEWTGLPPVWWTPFS